MLHAGSLSLLLQETTMPSVLLTPEWVTTANMNNTVIRDHFVPAHQLCSPANPYAAECKAAGITP